MPDASNVRNIALLSHGGAGKTSLAEALLFTCKMITRLGKVEEGNTISDYEPEEIKRKTSVQTTLIPCPWLGNKINFLDTPGYDDFSCDVVAALKVVEGAIIVVSATSGVEVGTEHSWQRCEESGIPRMFFINKLDRENSNFHTTLKGIQATFGNGCVPLQLPIGYESGFKGVVDLLNLPDNIPGDVSEEVHEWRERLIEAIAESDDRLATKYLEGESISDEELGIALRQAILSGKISPVLNGSALGNLGIEELLNITVSNMPSPAEAQKYYVENELPIDPTSDGPLAAFVFKTTADPFVGKLSLFRVYSGTIKANSEVWNQAKQQTERIGQVFVLKGKTQEQAQSVSAGDIGAVSKLTVTTTNDTLCAKETPLSLDPIKFPVGYCTMAVEPKTKADVDKMSMALTRITEEDPSLTLSRSQDTGETLLSGLGDSHLEVTMERIRRKLGADLELHTPKIAYKETITSTVRAEYKHKKQSGGHGQYGHVLLRLEPLERGEGFRFSSEIVGGAIPKEYIPAVEKGVQKAMKDGVITGHPLVDVGAIVYDGSYHDVDSSGICYEIAGSNALRLGAMEANPHLLEPIYKLTVTVPDSYTGEIIGDLNGKRGKVVGMTPLDGQTVIEAEAPQSELLKYATDMRSMTQGRGSFVVEYSHYEGVPVHITQKVIENTQKNK